MTNLKPIKKIIIPAAGWGTRFLPLTKVIDKELIPILNKPALDYLIHECIDSGIEEVIIVTTKRKQAIQDYFKTNKTLETLLLKKDKQDLYNEVIKTNMPCKITYVFQEQQFGLGHAIWVARDKIGANEPFGIILGDDLLYSKTPGIKQLINAYNKTGSSILGVQEVEDKHIHKYGIVIPKSNIQDNLFEITGAIEKPRLKDAPSRHAIIGRYVFTSKFMNMLSHLTYNDKAEANLIDAFNELLLSEKLYAYNLDAIRYDLGSKEGFVKATIDYALNDKEISQSIKEFLKDKK